MRAIKAIGAWGVALLVFGAIFIVFTAPDRIIITQMSEDLVQRRLLLARLESLPERESAIRTVLQELDDGLAERNLYIGEASSIRTEIQRDVRDIAAKSNVRINSMRPLGTRRASDQLSLSAIQLSYDATNSQNIEFLGHLENAEPVLRVQRLSIVIQAPSSEAMPARLTVNVEVAGYKKREELTR